jgi:hypothetical protein
MPPESLLNGGLGLLPLAPVSAVAETDLPAVLEQMDNRLRTEATPEEVGQLWTATGVLMGLRYPTALITQVIERASTMQDSTFFQVVEAIGAVKARQEDLIRIGGKRIGQASAEAEAALRAIKDLDRLARMLDRLMDDSAADWNDLLATP